jgi:hypothetical protein
VGLLREDSFKLLDTPLAYLYTWVGALFLPFACMASLGFYLLSRRRRWLGLFLVALASGLLYGAMTVAKAPVATLVLLLLLFVYMYRRGRVGRVGVLAPVLVLLYPLAVVMASYWEELTLYEAADALFNRMFYLPARVLFWYFELFPPASLGGRTSQNLAWLMGWKHFDIENYVGIHGLGYQGSVSANGAFIGYLHADFGWLGVLGGGLAVGVIMQACQVYLVRRVKTVSSLAVYAYLMLAFWYLHSTGLPIVLVSRGVFVVLLLPALFELATGIVQRISGSSPPAVRIPGLARSLRDARG